jgi:HlyD family secretion protein
VFEIETYIPEVNIAAVQVGDFASTTLDAYGDVSFDAQVLQIDPAKTQRDGVATYKTTLVFLSHDERIRSGMTAIVTIKIGEKNNVLAIPGNYIREDKVARKFYVNVVDIEKDDKVTEREIKTGIRGSDGMTEVISGLENGEIVSEIVKK